MKKVLLIIFTCLLFIAGYYFLRIRNLEVNKNVYLEEKTNLLEYLDKINRPLSMLIISNSIDNININKNTNFLENKTYKQQFVMEYYLSKTNNLSKFLILDQMGNIDNSSFPTDEMSTAYLKNDVFNKYYKELFDKDFKNNEKIESPYKEYDKDYVYYINRRSGSNGMFIIGYDINNIQKSNKEYKAKITLEYSDNLKNIVKDNEVIIKYKYNKNKNLILNSIEFI